jgi:hypothetical protein
LDKNDPFLRRNLNRLEARFRDRYYSSVQKDVNRRKKGKSSHKTTLKSIAENWDRLEEVRKIRFTLFDQQEPEKSGKSTEIDSEMLKSVKVLPEERYASADAMG